MPNELVSVLIVTYNSAPLIFRCLESLAQQTYKPLEVIVVDNASTDSTRDSLSHSPVPIRLLYNEKNTGFAAAQNQAIRQTKGEWLLVLNPDVVLDPQFLSVLVEAGNHDETLGALCGKLSRWQLGSEPEFTDILDSTGMYFTRNLRHLDRGGDTRDVGQYEKPEYVFGATGAAALFRRKAVEDLSFEGQFFDEDFFAYREDADLAWRAQIFGWRTLYSPKAVGWHVRRVTPERFSQLPHSINWHSIKNRFLMRIANISPRLYLQLLLPITARDLLVVGYCFFRNWKYLSALVFPVTHLRRHLRKRRWVQSHRRISDRDLEYWFQGQAQLKDIDSPRSRH